MSTALTIVNDSLKEIGILAEGETATGTMADDAFRALNRIMELMSNSKSFAYSNEEISRTLTGQASFTIGLTGNLVVARPIKIDSATVVQNGITYGIEVIDTQQWDEISLKTITGSIPEAIYYEPTMPNGTVYIWPQVATGTLYMRTTQVVNSFASLGTTLSMPPGYEECLIKNLAVNVSPQYPACILSPLTVKVAANSLRMIERTNRQIPILSIDPALTANSHSGVAAIIRGY